MRSTIVATFAASLVVASLVAAHGIVTDIEIDGEWYTSSLVFEDPYKIPIPERITWSFFGSGNSPVADFTTRDIVCNENASAAALVAEVDAGAEITFYWGTWPESHKGPVMTYLANCGSDCRTVDPAALFYFKIDHAGLEDGEWISDQIIANNLSYTITIPEDIAPGNYLIRHELLALHLASDELGAQFYPMCANLRISGSGIINPTGVKFPGAYKMDDPGILVNIYNDIDTYTIPGPPPYNSDNEFSDDDFESVAEISAASVSVFNSSDFIAFTLTKSYPALASAYTEPSTSDFKLKKSFSLSSVSVPEGFSDNFDCNVNG
ncbi:hypothetical protein DV453_004305 [Geotrichum candidum]|nr:hypothetical protein DV453_004305 [Geotrichum candidum]